MSKATEPDYENVTITHIFKDGTVADSLDGRSIPLDESTATIQNLIYQIFAVNHNPVKL